MAIRNKALAKKVKKIFRMALAERFGLKPQ